MGRLRFQGVKNVVNFNRSFYAVALAGVVLFLASAVYLDWNLLYFVAFAIAIQTCTSILVSYYVYDHSGLYRLEWAKNVGLNPGGSFLNVHAGFDETTAPLTAAFPNSRIVAVDFYDPHSHSERSISRAQNAGGTAPAATKISTSAIPAGDGGVDAVFAIFSAHEIRLDDERTVFFREIRRVIGDSGRAVVTEHLRDPANILAYSLGSFHFLPRAAWISTFERAGLRVINEFKLTPFVTTFILESDGAAA
jgi:ubiquinone/menaquinone biosynthesis C-methylase UbiE